MKKRIGVITKNENLYNKIRLLLRSECESVLIKDPADLCGTSLIFADIDTSNIPEGVKAVSMSAVKECDISLPFKHEDVLAYASEASETGEYIDLLPDGKGARFGDITVKLTDVEYRLLRMLIEADGKFVSRDLLLEEIWGKDQESGVVNVYIHYLRSKLEKDGRKVILSSRKEGYGIDEKYRRGR